MCVPATGLTNAITDHSLLFHKARDIFGEQANKRGARAELGIASKESDVIGTHSHRPKGGGKTSPSGKDMWPRETLAPNQPAGRYPDSQASGFSCNQKARANHKPD